ncbi:MAG: hypothetical protein Unbinned8472contig1000_17 [Prokaryotic dsDNA virus sp.]|nr:MAG: hypothetical protein Unbinned8472contig1000_17 [Prokaryotic dsDNA virus sp.]|tara:strand:+ start:8049 stop:8537 length:489 start_codon:yes stop_codon:yes gene_type:complete
MFEDVRDKIAYDPVSGSFIWVKFSKGRKKSKPGFIMPNGYRSLKIKGKKYLAHRLAWMLYYDKEIPPLMQIDHINGDKDDNRICNLRVVTPRVNCKNLPKTSRNKSGLLGVCWAPSIGKWLAQISVEGKNKNLGEYRDFFEACCARKSAEVRYGYHENHGRD